jgi:formamidopyrimidine-DNA glycosylase
MPELPEVEIACRNLRSWVRGGKIAYVVVARSRVVRGATPAVVARAVGGRSVVAVDRRGKWIRITLDDELRAFSHLGMSGRWLKRSVDDDTERSERLRLDIERRGRRTSLRYVDPRMFGRFVVAKTDIREWTTLGPDPLNEHVDGKVLARAIAGRKRAIKEVLMDQLVVAGIGNIQATDALFRARIDPRSRADRLSRRDAGALARAIRWSIDRTLALEEGPEITYVEDANAPNPFIVYGRGGDPCPRCGAVLQRIVLGGRTTVFCAECQERR